MKKSALFICTLLLTASSAFAGVHSPKASTDDYPIEGPWYDYAAIYDNAAGNFSNQSSCLYSLGKISIKDQKITFYGQTALMKGSSKNCIAPDNIRLKNNIDTMNKDKNDVIVYLQVKDKVMPMINIVHLSYSSDPWGVFPRWVGDGTFRTNTLKYNVSFFKQPVG